MLVGPWPPTIGGVTTFMLGVVNSPLSERYAFLRHTTSRPAKRGVTDNYGYRAMFRGGAARMLKAGVLTLWHLVAFPLRVAIEKPDLVQVQSSDFQTFWEAAIYVWACRALRRPVLLRLGGAFDYFYRASSPWTRAAIRRVLQWPDRLIVQSQYWRDFVTPLGRTADVIVLPNAVPDGLVTAVERPQRPEPVCLFAAGTEAVRKGLDDVIEAMRVLAMTHARVRFHIVAATDAVAQRIRSAGLSHIARIEGYLDRDSMLAAMRAADIFLLPSRAEGFPNALIEAMATGLTCIVTPVGSVSEIVDAGGAIVVPVKDARAMADAIARLAGDADLRARMGETARAIVAARYVQSVVLPRLEEAWMSLV